MIIWPIIPRLSTPTNVQGCPDTTMFRQERHSNYGNPVQQELFEIKAVISTNTVKPLHRNVNNRISRVKLFHTEQHKVSSPVTWVASSVVCWRHRIWGGRSLSGRRRATLCIAASLGAASAPPRDRDCRSHSLVIRIAPPQEHASVLSLRSDFPPPLQAAAPAALSEVAEFSFYRSARISIQRWPITMLRK